MPSFNYYTINIADSLVVSHCSPKILQKDFVRKIEGLVDMKTLMADHCQGLFLEFVICYLLQKFDGLGFGNTRDDPRVNTKGSHDDGGGANIDFLFHFTF